MECALGRYANQQRLIHILVREIVCDLDEAANDAVLLIHWTGGRHTEVRVPRVKTGRYPSNMAPSAVDALRKLAGHWPDRQLAVSLNRMRCKTGDGETWTTVRVREMREHLGIAEYDPGDTRQAMISLMKAAERLGICIGSAKSLALKGILPATQILPGSPWLVSVEALASEAVQIGVQRVVNRRPRLYEDYQYDKVVRLPGLWSGVHYETSCGGLIKLLWFDGQDIACSANGWTKATSSGRSPTLGGYR